MKIHVYVLVGLLALLIWGCGSSPNIEQETVISIDTDLVGDDRRTLANFMKLIPEEHRDNVFYVTEDNRILTNKVSLQNSLSIGQQISANTFRDQFGRLFTSNLPDTDQNTLSTQALTPFSCTSTTGAYRRISAKTGYSYANMGLRLPTKRLEIPYTDTWINYSYENFVEIADPNKETAYFILGGRTSAGADVDAYLQYNPSANDWTQGIRFNGKVYLITNGSNLQGPQYRVSAFDYPAGLGLTFYVEPDNRINFYVAAKNLISIPASSWKKNGASQILKFTTSIAQDVNNFASQSELKAIISSYVLGTSSSQYKRMVQNQVGEDCKFPAPLPSGAGIVGTVPEFPFPGFGEKITISLRQ